MRDALQRAWTLCHWLSLDVALGAVGTHQLLCQAWGAPARWSVSLALFCATISIYSIDHILDAQRLSARLSTERLCPRRAFHYAQRKLLCLITIGSVTFGLLTVGMLPSNVLKSGLVLFGISALYLYLAQVSPRHLKKEPMVALAYASALSLWPICHALTQSDGVLSIDGSSLLVSAQIAALAGANLSLFSIIDYGADLAEGERSLSTRHGVDRAQSALRWCLIVVMLLMLCRLLVTPSVFLEQGVIALMAVTLWVIHRHDDHLLGEQNCEQRRERVRRWGEVIFCFPWLICS